MFHKSIEIKTNRQQQGFLLPLALFILVVMGGFALAISRTGSQSQTASIQEFMNVQSFYAAESGAQRGMQTLFLNNTARQTIDNLCNNMNVTHNFAAADGLKVCTAQVACSCRYRNDTACMPTVAANYSATATDSVLKSFYTITSVGTCGPQQYRSVRTVQVGAFMDQE